MIDPIEIIGKARHRIAELAALRVAIYVAPPVLTTLALGLAFEAIGPATWERWGYVLAPSHGWILRVGLLAATAAGLVIGGLIAMLAWRRASDFVEAAAQIDSRLDAKEEILTLATLAGPKHADDTSRSTLFPILWRRSIDYLSKFDPANEFRPELKRPLARSSALTLALIVALGLSMLALVRPPHPLEIQARKLRSLAGEITHTDSSPGAKALAEQLRSTASDLDNAKLPPERKLEQLALLMQKLEEIRNPPEAEKKNQPTGSGKGDSNKGKGQGKGDTGKGDGQGKGEDQSGEGPGKGEGSGGKDKGGEARMMEVRNELSKSKLQIETETKEPDKSKAAANQEKKKTEQAVQAGNKSNQPGPTNDVGGLAQANRPKPDQSGGPEQRKGSESAKDQQKKDSGQPGGDTHLGQFPAPVRFERFYKAGEHGPPIDIKDARYVLFRIPPATTASGAGKTVLDKERPTASTPYSNLPLKEARITAAPDERQLVPPRYRDLLR